MNVLVYLVPMALALGLTGLAAFLWSMRAGQYDDLEGAAMRVLSDDDVDWVNATCPGGIQNTSSFCRSESCSPDQPIESGAMITSRPSSSSDISN